MEWSEYLLMVTEGMDSVEAQAVREELSGHLEALYEELLEGGLGATEAQAEAMRRLGDVGLLRQSFADAFPSRRYPTWLRLVVLVPLGFGSLRVMLGHPDWMMAVLLNAVVVGMIGLGRPTRDIPRAFLVGRWFQTHWPILASAALAGIGAALRPWWNGAPIDGLPASMAGAMPFALYLLPYGGVAMATRWGRVSAQSSMWAVGVAFTVFSFVAGAVFLRLWPAAPVTGIDWYGGYGVGIGSVEWAGPIAILYTALSWVTACGVLWLRSQMMVLHFKTRLRAQK